MTTSIIIVLCSLFLLAYIFDISARITKIPSVISLLLLGWIVRQSTEVLHITVPELNPLLPIFGTIGLILIVLEGSLDLELNRSKIPIIGLSIVNALIPMLVLAAAISLTLYFTWDIPYKIALINAIPFCVISSAIAIPGVRSLPSRDKEFVTYESSFSDIIGVLLFNFIALNTVIDFRAFGYFGLELLIIIAISFIAVLGLSFLLSRINHHVTFTPIILLVILIYSVSKVFHLPSLLFILVFGLFLGNLDELKRFKWIELFHPEKLDKDVSKFKEINIEATFLIRSVFFLLFGYLMEVGEILNTQTIPWAVSFVIAIILIRWIMLRISKLPTLPLLFIAPRGLITILLFLAILPEHAIPIVSKSLIIQTILLSVIVLMIGSIVGRRGLLKD